MTYVSKFQKGRRMNRHEHIVRLNAERELLQGELAAASLGQKARIQGLLTATERALRWQRSRAGLTSTPIPDTPPGPVETPRKNPEARTRRPRPRKTPQQVQAARPSE